jgi:competence protein ComEA
MPLPGRRVVLLASALALLGAALVGRVLRQEPPAGGPVAEAATAGAEPQVGSLADPPAALAEVTVHVAGRVRRPGVYRLAAGARVLDAVQRAGGAAPKADLGGLNLAALLADGEQVVVPAKGAVAAPGGTSGTGDGTSGTGDGPPAIVHLNGADVDDLDALPGVGPALAERIVAFGREHGGFRSVDDLLEVPGIGPGRLEALRGLVAP